MSAFIWPVLCAALFFLGVHITMGKSRARIDEIYRTVDKLEARVATLKSELERSQSIIAEFMSHESDNA